ncbi:hypothetical protein [Bacillus cereus]|uniref:hypothetical protein n=1 Tax=Bacillus cereus TaxID=1396 RepID=UPI000BF70DED|nr:hypothetical protein [Bacillus cereus]PEW69960.1 hypothetical protein CN448_11825 [Bacillus cereus]PFC61599.1 hypothetical protein CN267_11075 [Bacillus cereus]
MKEKLKKFWKALKATKKATISVTVNFKNGWWQRMCGLIIFGSAWQCVAGGNNAWYQWVLFVLGSWLGMYNLDKGYAKLHQEEKKNEQNYTRSH